MYVWRHWWHSRSQISHYPSDLLLTCAWGCRGLDDPTCSEYLPEGTCHFESPEHVPRTSATAQTCARGPGRLPVCHGAESTRKDPRPEEKEIPKCQKNTLKFLYIVLYPVYSTVISGDCELYLRCTRTRYTYCSTLVLYLTNIYLVLNFTSCMV